jgi:hypothetical protein
MFTSEFADTTETAGKQKVSQAEARPMIEMFRLAIST